MAVNALTKSYMTNILVGDEIQKLGLSYKPQNNSAQGEANHLNEILKYGTIKKACCLYNTANTQDTSFTIPVRIPLPKNRQFDSYGTSVRDVYKKYNFVEAQVTIPKDLCSKSILNFTTTPDITFLNGTTVCNDFMKTYCRNVSKQFQQDTGFTVNNLQYSIDFPAFKPECACYTEFPDDIDILNVTPVCSNTGCEKSGLSVYHAPFESCNATICKNTINFLNTNAKDITLLPKMSNSCSGHTATTEPAGETAAPAGETTVPAGETTVPPVVTNSNGTVVTTSPSALSQLFSQSSQKTTTTTSSSKSSSAIIIVVVIIIVIIISVIIFIFMKNKNKT
jgi:hypothetical protein